jgi:hypothetical protein
MQQMKVKSKNQKAKQSVQERENWKMYGFFSINQLGADSFGDISPSLIALVRTNQEAGHISTRVSATLY